MSLINKITILLFSALMFSNIPAEAQRFITKTGTITFHSDGALEKIEAVNNKVNAALDTQTGKLVFKLLMKSFVFEKALMQEHFNENYVESDKFPVSTFKGKVLNMNEIDFSKEGEYPAKVEGDLTIHGKTNTIKTDGKFVVNRSDIHGESEFYIKLADYDIDIPSLVADKIAEEVLIKINIDLKPLKK